MTDRTRLPSDEQLVERFFERQRHEIMQRVDQRQAARMRFRRHALALAASAALVALLLGGELLRGPSAPPATLAWVESATDVDPWTSESALDLFGAWGEPAPDAVSAGLDDPLPPLTLELDDELLDDIDFDPFLPDGSESENALAS